MSFKWDANSAYRKATSNVTVTLGGGIAPVSISKTTAPHNPKTDAYRSCSNCGKHVNYHNNGKCP